MHLAYANNGVPAGLAASMAADVDGQMAFPDGNDEELVERSWQRASKGDPAARLPAAPEGYTWET